MTAYTSTAERDGRWWVVQCDQVPGALSQVSRLDQAVEHQREAIALVTGEDETSIDVVVRPALDVELKALLHNVEATREEAVVLGERASELTRQAVDELIAKGLSTRDVGTILGISFQRAAQLAGPRAKATPR